MTITGNITTPAVTQTAASLTAPGPVRSSGPGDLTAEEQRVVAALQKRDAEVRRHEQAHKRVAGSFALGGPKFDYQTGTDGKRYAVGGEVQLDTSEISNNPAATIRKAEQIKRAALAPEKPSAQDRQVASEADRMKAKAQKELREEKSSSEKVFYTETGTNARPGSVADIYA